MLLAVSVSFGCGGLKQHKKATALESTLNNYRAAMRWSYFDSVHNFRDPEALEPVPQRLDNVRVTSYEVVRPPIMLDDTTASQTARVEYVLEDRQRVRTILDRQRWVYDTEAKTWWLTTPIPSFE
jgi:hypothetical protein